MQKNTIWITGSAGRLGRVLVKLLKEYTDVKVIATGGMAHMVKSNSSVIDEINPDLTLTGLRIIYEKNQA